MVVFGLVPVISFTVFLFYAFLALGFVPIPVSISLPPLFCQWFTFFPSFLVYFPTFTSFFPLSPRNLVGFSPLLWRLRIRMSTARARLNIGKCRKRRKWRERRSHWRLKLRTSCDAVGINVLCNMREDSIWKSVSGKHSPPRCVRWQKKNQKLFSPSFPITLSVWHLSIWSDLHHLTSLQQGKNLVHLIDRSDEPHCFRLHKDRVFYAPESSMKLAISVARPNLVSLGTCFGKFSKSGKFKLHVTSLDYLAQYAKYKASITFKWIARCITEKRKKTAYLDLDKA